MATSRFLWWEPKSRRGEAVTEQLLSRQNTPLQVKNTVTGMWCLAGISQETLGQLAERDCPETEPSCLSKVRFQNTV